MKFVILAGEGPQDTRGINAARSSILIKQTESLLERQVNILSFLGIKKKDIVGVITNRQVSGIRKVQTNLSCTLIEVDSSYLNSSDSLFGALNYMNIKEKILIIYGDLVLENWHVRKFLNRDFKAALLTRPPLRIGETGARVKVNLGFVEQISRNDPTLHFPWEIFGGMALLDEDSVQLFLSSYDSSNSSDFIDWLSKNLDSQKFQAISVGKNSGHSDLETTELDLIGGSFANLKRKNTIIKSASGPGKEKVKDEIEWLKNVPKTLTDIFPKIIASGETISSVWFEMPFYSYPNLRNLILTESKSSNEVTRIISSILDTLNSKLYKFRVVDAPENWTHVNHVERVISRTNSIINSHNELKKFLQSPELEINGKYYVNPLTLLNKMKLDEAKFNIFSPRKLRLIHGDLHFQNILIDDSGQTNNYILADPRGNLEGSDVFYDAGKLLHSCHGKYDLIHTDQFNLEVLNDEFNQFQLIFPNQRLSSKYDSIHLEILPVLKSTFGFVSGKYDNLWLEKSLFAEAMHFASLMIFHLKGDGFEKRAMALQITGTKLLNEFYNEVWCNL